MIAYGWCTHIRTDSILIVLFGRIYLGILDNKELLMRGGCFLEFEFIKNYLLVAIAKCASISALINTPVNYSVTN